MPLYLYYRKGGKVIENLDNKKYWIWFSNIKSLGPKRKMELLKKYKNPEKIYNLKKEELLENKNIGEKIVENILEKQIRENIKYHIQYMKKNNIDIININEKYYPEKLKNIYDPPISLYIKGNKKILNNKNISIIGCRDYSEYGEKSAKYFSYNLAKNGNTIVSGLAKGIDTFSHIGTIIADGKTIAILGNGLDTIYPKENIEIANKIIKKGGAIISEYPLGTKPDRINFPARNRIVSGISDAIIVIEAKEKSGTLITVDFALEQGRDVYVVPGNINSANSVGTNELIKQGAKIITSIYDLEKNLYR